MAGLIERNEKRLNETTSAEERENYIALRRQYRGAESRFKEIQAKLDGGKAITQADMDFIDTAYNDLLNDSFVAELREWYNGNRNGSKKFYVGRTSKVLTDIAGKEKDIYWYGSKINEIKKKHHNMTLPVIEQVPYILESPVMVLDSRTVDGRIVMFGDVYDKSGSPVLAAVELSASKGAVNDFAVIASAYARGEEIRDAQERVESLQRFINESNVRYVTEDKKRIQSWLKRTRLQLPIGVNSGFNTNSMPDSAQNVKKNFSLNDSTGRELSEGQQEYFKESEIRDIRGAAVRFANP